MRAQRVRRKTHKAYWGLKCRGCGNNYRFIEIMSYESHIVTRELDYVHLCEAETDRYECRECGRRVAPRWLRKAIYS
jgi:hypothetical protein